MPPVVAESVHLCFTIELSPQRAARGTRCPRFGVDVHILHGRQVDHQPRVDRRPPADVVTTAADRDFEPLFAGEADGKRDIGRCRDIGR
jgi:hypothetical protein